MGVPISNVTRRVVYAASGTGPYNFTFEILAASDIAVYRDDTLLTLTTDYTVTINANGTGFITLVASPTGATQIAIVGNRTISRSTDFTTGGDFFANTLNDELDQQTIFAQQNAEGLQRALQAPQTDPTTIDMTLPRASVRASKVLSFDANGNPAATEFIGSNRGNWVSGRLYFVRDIVKDTSTQNIWQCQVRHTSSGSQPIATNTDAAKWFLLVDAASAGASATAASNSATAAATSATNASNSASAASTSATNAASSASAASTSATNAASSASSASGSASTASTAATNASNSATAAATSATNAASSASAASTSATNAANSASAASTSASNASTSATNAANSASSASSSASTATTQATNAASSATAAAASAAAAAASFDAFDDIYLGAKSSDPTVDNDGNALTTGDQYFNTSANELRVYNGSTWQAASTVGGTVTSLNVTGATTLGQNPTLSAGTANGVAYLNGSKVLTTGSALTFDGANLGVGTASPGARLQVEAAAGSGGGDVAIRLRDSTSTNTLQMIRTGATYSYGGMGGNEGALYSANTLTLCADSSGPIKFATNGSEQMRLTSTGLGIGTSSPNYRADILASNFRGLRVQSSGDDAIITMGSQIASSQYWSIAATSNTSGQGSNRFIIETTDANAGGTVTPRMTIDSSGNLGLGVTPSAWGSGWVATQVAGGGAALASRNTNPEVYLTANAHYSGTNWIYKTSSVATQYSQDTGVHKWWVAPSGTAGNAISFTQAMTLDASGNLGIGTSSPAVKLHVSGGFRAADSANSANYITIGSGNDAPIGNNSVVCQTGSLVVGTVAASTALQFATVGTERARIDSSGNLMVAKTTSADTTVGAAMLSNGRVTSTLSASNSSDSTLHVYSTGASAYRFYVNMAGTIFATSTSISGISDASLKENVRDLETGLTEVMALKPRRFDWKNGDAHNVAGFVAQEVEQVLPELVTDYVYNKDEDGNDIIKKSLKMGDILPTLVKAIQEQQAMIQQLQAEVAALKGN